MPDYKAFSRRLREQLAGQNQTDVAGRLGYTQSRISQFLRGERPSREFIERLVAAYDLPREEWLTLAGFGPPGSENAEEQRLRQIVEDATQRAVERLVPPPDLSGYQHLVSGLEQLITEEFPDDAASLTKMHGGARNLTIEEAESIIRAMRDKLRRRRDGD